MAAAKTQSLVKPHSFVAVRHRAWLTLRTFKAPAPEVGAVPVHGQDLLARECRNAAKEILCDTAA